MTDDKIMTTFETKLTWYDPMNILPPMEKLVFIFSKALMKQWDTNTSGIFIAKLTEKDFFTLTDDLDDDESGIYINKVQWWAYLPQFD